MLYNPKDYRTNRKAVLELRKKLFRETITTSEAISMGAKKTQLIKWVKERKMNVISFGDKNSGVSGKWGVGYG